MSAFKAKAGGTHVDREASEKQTSEDKIEFVIIRKKGQHPVHQVRWFLVPRKRERNQSFESLIIIQCI